MANETRGSVAVYPGPNPEAEHERAAHHEIARRLAKLQGLNFAGAYDPAEDYRAPLYFVPVDVFVGVEEAHRLGIHNEHDLFGGVVPQPFMASKSITHPLVSSESNAPSAWPEAFCRRVRDVVLSGYAAFSLEDAQVAGLRLLERGPVRIKSVRATAGRGQAVITTADELTQQLRALDAEEVEQHGLVLEEHLAEVTTHSVGQIRVGDRLATYYGTQHLTEDNDGATVYGGTDIVIVQGGFEALLALEIPDEIRQSIAKARVFDTAATECLPGFFASRRNYDVACGIDAKGERRVGVLEQSWRIGGASSAEVVALEAFQATPTLRVVHASSLEVYGTERNLPADAIILYQGNDADVGPITKCVMLGCYDYEQ